MKPLVARYAPWIAIAVSALVIAVAAVVLQVGVAGIHDAEVAPPPMMSNPF